jgi:hypothetical protein
MICPGYLHKAALKTNLKKFNDGFWRANIQADGLKKDTWKEFVISIF